MINPVKLFSQAEKDALAQSVKDAEGRTSGEIVPFIVGQSDPYIEGPLRAGIAAMIIVLGAFVVIHFATDLWLPISITGIVEITIAAFGILYLLTSYLPALKRFFVSSKAMQQRVNVRASLAFLSEQVFATRERTGILIFISLFERRVRVLGDSGINEKIRQEQWDGVSAILVDSMKKGKPFEGMKQAITLCGHLLEESGVERRADDTDELDDSLRVSDR
jgi:putative membrane protein